MEFFSSIDHTPIHISDSGKGDKVIFFLHGYLETLYIWEEFIDLLPEDFRTIVIDLPGQGLSTSHPEANTMEFCSNIIVGVLDLLKIENCILVGHSMGGYIAQTCMKLFPDRILAIANFNSNPYADDPSKKDDRLKEISFIESGKLMSLASIAIPNMYSPENAILLENKIQETVENCDTHDPAGIVATIKGLILRENNTEFLASSPKPILFILGDKDKYLPSEKIDQIKKDIPNAKYLIIKETGHNSFIEQPQAVADGFIDFVNSL